VRLPRVGPPAFLRLAQASLVLVVLNIVSGASVRLTDSGLGCPDWPTCSARAVTPPLSFHPVMEFANRMVVTLLVVGVAVTLLAAWRRAPRRRDLIWLSGGLAGGVVGEAALGGIVVYSKLNPYAVMTHFMVGIGLLSVAVVLCLRAGRAPGRARALLGPGPRRLAGALAGVLLLAVAAGTATTGSGPHAGGADAVRLPVPLDDMARTHSSLVLVSGALLLALVWVLYRSAAPEAIQGRGRMLLAAMVAQGAVGYTQFFLHLPALLVGIHVFGATVVWGAALWFSDGLRARAPEVAAPPAQAAPASRDAAAVPAAAVPAGPMPAGVGVAPVAPAAPAVPGAPAVSR
jgi:cytochrome c oxidase assembly protein subunit 15